MTALIWFLLVSIGLALAANAFLRSSPAAVAGGVRTAGAVALLAFGAALTLMGRPGFGIPLLGGAFALWRSRAISRGGASSSGSSTVSSAWLQMTLDHDSGDIDGDVRQGEFAGSRLSDLPDDALGRLAREIISAADEESVRLLEAYLDRRTPGWRDGVDGGEGSGLGAAPGSGAMGEQEAYEILGLSPGASETEIREAHRGLMKRAHPDAGGSGELAARLNQAKEILLRAHR